MSAQTMLFLHMSHSKSSCVAKYVQLIPHFVAHWHFASSATAAVPALAFAAVRAHAACCPVVTAHRHVICPYFLFAAVP
jgi:hypothetical protein